MLTIIPIYLCIVEHLIIMKHTNESNHKTLGKMVALYSSSTTLSKVPVALHILCQPSGILFEVAGGCQYGSKARKGNLTQSTWCSQWSWWQLALNKCVSLSALKCLHYMTSHMCCGIVSVEHFSYLANFLTLS